MREGRRRHRDRVDFPEEIPVIFEGRDSVERGDLPRSSSVPVDDAGEADFRERRVDSSVMAAEVADAHDSHAERRPRRARHLMTPRSEVRMKSTR